VARERRLENRKGVRKSEQRGEESLGKFEMRLQNGGNRVVREGVWGNVEVMEVDSRKITEERVEEKEIARLLL